MVTYSVNQKTYPTNRFLPVNNSVLVQPTEFLPPKHLLGAYFTIQWTTAILCQCV